MARSEFFVPVKKGFDETNQTIQNILQVSGFHPKDYNGESVWKKGTGMMTAMEYIKVEYSNGGVTLYGWIQAGVGAVGGKEMNLKGIVGIIPKKSVQKVIDKIIAAIS